MLSTRGAAHHCPADAEAACAPAAPDRPLSRAQIASFDRSAAFVVVRPLNFTVRRLLDDLAPSY